MPPLNGRESSILAYIARSPKTSETAIQRLVSELKGRAREIADSLTGASINPSEETKRSVEGLRAWARSLTAEDEG